MKGRTVRHNLKVNPKRPSQLNLVSFGSMVHKKILKIFFFNKANFYNQYKSTERNISQKTLEDMLTIHCHADAFYKLILT
jgi:hypothetical protein